MAAAPEFVTGYHAIVLAAGAGRRFGGRKLLAPWQDGQLLHGALSAAFAAPVETVTVLTGNDADEIEGVAERYAERAGELDRLRLVHVRQHEEGMAAALRTGIAALPDRARGCFIFLGDMPRIPRDAPFALLSALARAKAGAAVPVHDGQMGHPVLVSRKLFRRFARLTGDRGARRLLDELGSDLAQVPMADDGVLFDVDEPHQLGAG